MTYSSTTSSTRRRLGKFGLTVVAAVSFVRYLAPLAIGLALTSILREF